MPSIYDPKYLSWDNVYRYAGEMVKYTRSVAEHREMIWVQNNAFWLEKGDSYSDAFRKGLWDHMRLNAESPLGLELLAAWDEAGDDSDVKIFGILERELKGRAPWLFEKDNNH